MKGKRFLTGTAGRKLKLNDSEVLTLMMAAEFIPFPSGQQYLSYIRAEICR